VPRPLPLAKLREIVAEKGSANVTFRLEGWVCGISADRHLLTLQDDSNTVLLECPSLPPDLVAGQRLAIEGRECAIARDRYDIRIGSGPVIEIDGHHATITRSGSVFLQEGRQPFRLDWFNGLNLAELHLEYEGPGLPRQKVPASAFVHQEEGGAFAAGLRYQVFLKDWWMGIADFSGLQPVAEGLVPDLDLNLRPRPLHVGLTFGGSMEIPATGLYTFHLSSDDGARMFIGEPRVSYAVLSSGAAAKAPDPKPWRGMSSPDGGTWVSATGRVTFAGRKDGRLELDVSGRDASFHVTILDPGTRQPGELLDRDVRVQGIGRAEGIIVVNARHLEVSGDASGQPRLLTRATEVRRLQPEEARKPYRAQIRGVVTMSSQATVVLQDATGGVFVLYSAKESEPQPRPGEFWELEGNTDPGDFSPTLHADRATYLGSTPMPEAARPTWEQVASGGMDAEWVEIEGVVVSASLDRMELLTRDGRILINDNLSYPLPTHDMSSAELAALPGSVVRIRGVFTANWDSYGRVNAGICQMGNATMTVDEPAAGDPFSASPMQASDLLLFTSNPGVFKRVKVTGVVLHARSPEFFLSDGMKGFRILARGAPELRAGDQVEAAGFPRVGGPSPMLMEAKVRKTGVASLPEAIAMPAKGLPDAKLDSTRVKIEATLLSDTLREDERVLEMQSGNNRFIARLAAAARDGKPIERGSLLQLAGTYATFLPARPASAPDTFELLMNDRADLVILRRGAWWTVRHTIAAIAILSGGLLLVLIWNMVLRRTVGQRTRQLAVEIGEREILERHRAMEQERTRVAQDLHDELGSGLTEAGILTSLVKNPAVPANKKDGYLDQLGDVCSALVTGLDEIVWAVNPRYDSVTDLAGYLSLIAQRFLGLAGINCRLQIAESVAEYPLGSHQRHDIFLAFKEALNNIARHSQAREVRLSIQVEDGALQILLADDGRGMGTSEESPGSDGLVGMQERMEKLGGKCRITATPGGGTTVEFSLPLERSQE